MNVFDLFASIKLDDSEYEEGLSKAGSSLASFGKTAASGLAPATKATVAAGAAITTAMVAGATNTASLGDEIDKESQKLGISAEAYQEWDAILQHTGGSISNLKPALKTLSKEIETGSDAFEKLGISQEEVAGLSKEDLFSKVITQLQGMEDGTERTYLAQQLLGKSSMELGALLNTSAEDTEKMRQTVHDLGGVMSDDAVKAGAAFKDSLQDMRTVFGGMKNTLMGSFLPSLTGVTNGITAIFAGDKGGIQQVTEGVKSFISNIKDTIPQFMEAGADILEAFVGAIVENLPDLAETALELITTLAEGIMDQLPQIVDAAVEIISTIITTIAEELPRIIEAGVELITTLANSLAEQAPTLIPVILDALMMIVNTLIQNAPELLKAALTLIKALTKGLIDYLPELVKKLPEIISTMVETLIGMSGELVACAGDLLGSLITGLIEAIPELVKNIPQIITALVKGLLNGLTSIAEVGGQLIEGLWNGIDDKVEWIKDKIKGFGKAVISGIKKIFGISSPSKVMAEIGGFMGEGLGVGWDDAMKDVEKQMQDDLDLEGNVTMKTDVERGSAYGVNAGWALAGAGDIVIPIYLDGNQLDEVIVSAEQLRDYRSGGR